MVDWATLSLDDRRELLSEASVKSGRAAAMLEKDAWVVWTLAWIGQSRWADDLVFKGGTSLSKVFGAIERFSEDVDLTYDIRRLLPELGDCEADPLPPNNSQADRWSDVAREALFRWVREQVIPDLLPIVRDAGLSLEDRGEEILLRYPAAADAGLGYVASSVRLEFGGRATGEPAIPAQVHCDIAAAVPAAAALFPVARIRTMAAERTFWEKLTLAHAHCLQDRPPAHRFARHWYDIASLHRAGISQAALGDQNLAQRVVDHKRRFFRPARLHGVVDYRDCLRGGLCIRPTGDQAAALAKDYAVMRDAGLLWGWVPDWDTLLAEIGEVEALVNRSLAATRA